MDAYNVLFVCFLLCLFIFTLRYYTHCTVTTIEAEDATALHCTALQCIVVRVMTQFKEKKRPTFYRIYLQLLLLLLLHAAVTLILASSSSSYCR